MNLHRNAALSLKGRRELCRRVVEGERTVSEAARPPRSASAARASGWAGTEQRVQAIAALRRLRFTGSEIAEVLVSSAIEKCLWIAIENVGR